MKLLAPIFGPLLFAFYCTRAMACLLAIGLVFGAAVLVPIALSAAIVNWFGGDLSLSEEDPR